MGTKHTIMLSSGQRHTLFRKAREISPMLGDLFQNPADLTADDISQELDDLRVAEAQRQAESDAYRESLGNLLVTLSRTKQEADE